MNGQHLFGQSLDDKAVTSARRAARAAQADDPLRKRQWCVEFWRRCQITNKHYSDPHCWALYRNSTFWKYLLPKTKAYVEAKRDAMRKEYAADLAAYSRRCADKKALAAANRKLNESGQTDMVGYLS